MGAFLRGEMFTIQGVLMSQTEKARLESISNVSLYCAGVNSASIKYSFKVAERHLVGDSILEMGPAEGVMTELLAATGKKLTLVEGSGLPCAAVSPRQLRSTLCSRNFNQTSFSTTSFLATCSNTSSIQSTYYREPNGGSNQELGGYSAPYQMPVPYTVKPP
jgi:hypothetical protein